MAESTLFIDLLIGSLAGAILFVAGFLLGLWLARHNIRYVDVPKVEFIRTPAIPAVEKILEKPTPKPAPPMAATFEMRPDTRTTQQRVEDAAVGQLLSELPHSRDPEV